MNKTTLTINAAANTIEMTKEFAKNAKYFGTKEYKMLQEARKDYPTFSVVTKKTASRENYKGLTIDYMYDYIKNHSKNFTLETEDENGKKAEKEISALEIFMQLAGLDENKKKVKDAETAFYGEIRAWFLENYPEVKSKKDNIKKLLATKKKAS